MAVQSERTPARARIVFLVRVPEENVERFLAAYERIRYEVAGGVPGHILDQVCQSTSDPEQWLITSEWESIDYFVAWERSPGHRELAGPMRACMSEARSIKFEIREETSKNPSRLAG
jgi:heme oxygenase (mycobilin-producing)